jgi:uncharacterized protein YegP (UPF0339 family)
MATAPKDVHGARRVAGDARQVPEAAMLEFFVHQDNGGDYHWEIVGERGERLAQSGSFASYGDAERGARRVQEGARSARLEPHVAEARELVAG